MIDKKRQWREKNSVNIYKICYLTENGTSDNLAILLML